MRKLILGLSAVAVLTAATPAGAATMDRDLTIWGLAGYGHYGDAAGFGQYFEDLYVITSAGTVTLALALLARRTEPGILNYERLAWAVALTGFGMAILDLSPWLGMPTSTLACNTSVHLRQQRVSKTFRMMIDCRFGSSSRVFVTPLVCGPTRSAH